MEKKYYSELQLENKEIYLRQYLMKGGTYQFCWHKAVEIMLVLKGEIEVYIEGNSNTLAEGDVLLINSNLGHFIFSKDVNSITLVIEISPEFFRHNYLDIEELPKDFTSNSKTRYNTLFSQIRFYMSNIMFYSMKNTKTDAVSVKAFTVVLISEIIQNSFEKKIKSEQNRKSNNNSVTLQNAMDYIDRNFCNKLSLEEVAKVVGYNRTYLSTVFKRKIGITFNEYVMRVRLKNAVDCLSDIDIPIIDIALNNGFSDSKIFVQYMKKYCGKTPQKYRLELENNPEMSRFYGDNRYVSYLDAEVEHKLQFYKNGNFCSSHKHDKEEIVGEISRYCNNILNVINDMF